MTTTGVLPSSDGTRVALHGTMVYKLFAGSAHAARRSAGGRTIATRSTAPWFFNVPTAQPSAEPESVGHLGAKVFVRTDDFTVLQYPVVCGSHAASFAGQFEALIRWLREFHAAGYCHGDVRAYNIVFREGTDSVFLDVDLAAAQGSLYCDAYAPGPFSDGRRARGAAARQPMSFDHDWFSLGCVMELHEVTSVMAVQMITGVAVTTLWDQATSQVRQGDVDAALRTLESIQAVPLVLSAKMSTSTLFRGGSEALVRSPPDTPPQYVDVLFCFVNVDVLLQLTYVAVYFLGSLSPR